MEGSVNSLSVFGSFPNSDSENHEITVLAQATFVDTTTFFLISLRKFVFLLTVQTMSVETLNLKIPKCLYTAMTAFFDLVGKRQLLFFAEHLKCLQIEKDFLLIFSVEASVFFQRTKFALICPRENVTL